MKLFGLSKDVAIDLGTQKYVKGKGIRTLKDGVIADSDITQIMMKKINWKSYN